MRHTEENTQIQCVRWFAYQYPHFSLLLHHSPNGGFRNITEAVRFKQMGTRKGFPDLVLLVPAKGYHGLFVEMKATKGKQSDEQKQYQKAVENVGYKYVLCRSIESFIAQVNDYLR